MYVLSKCFYNTIQFLIIIIIIYFFRVVTGMRFVKQNRIIHIQLQEGQLLERGKINASTVRWIPVDDYTIFDKGIREGVDYHTLAWDRRDIDLDDLDAYTKHVVVGFKIPFFLKLFKLLLLFLDGN